MARIKEWELWRRNHVRLIPIRVIRAVRGYLQEIAAQVLIDTICQRNGLGCVS